MCPPHSVRANYGHKNVPVAGEGLSGIGCISNGFRWSYKICFNEAWHELDEYAPSLPWLILVLRNAQTSVMWYAVTSVWRTHGTEILATYSEEE